LRGSKRTILPAAVLASTLFLIELTGCAPQTGGPPPPDLIGRAEMVSVITDLTLSEAALGSEPLATFNDTLRRINVLKEHNMTHARFINSFRFYTEHPKELKSIYDEVLAGLEQNPKADSVAR
jgi:hypothetical protein